MRSGQPSPVLSVLALFWSRFPSLCRVILRYVDKQRPPAGRHNEPARNATSKSHQLEARLLEDGESACRLLSSGHRGDDALRDCLGGRGGDDGDMSGRPVAEETVVEETVVVGLAIEETAAAGSAVEITAAVSRIFSDGGGGIWGRVGGGGGSSGCGSGAVAAAVVETAVVEVVVVSVGALSAMEAVARARE